MKEHETRVAGTTAAESMKITPACALSRPLRFADIFVPDVRVRCDVTL